MEHADEIKNTVMSHSEKVEHIVSGACKYFGISRDRLMEKHGTRSVYWNEKRYFVPLLYDFTNARHTEIRDILGYRTASNVSACYARMKNELSEDMYGFDKTKRVYNELIEFINLK